MSKKLKQDFTSEEWAEKLKNSSYQRAKRSNREAWLTLLVNMIRPEFNARTGATLPDNIRVTFGWTTRARKSIGECWQASNTKDKHFEIFISPRHEGAEPRLLCATLVHELIHTLPKCANHGKLFQKHAAAMGLEGKPTATFGGIALWAWVDDILAAAGPFPGAEIVLSGKKGKKQTTRMVKCECPTCGLIFRMSRQAIHVAQTDGLINCPSIKCGDHIEVELTGDEEE